LSDSIELLQNFIKTQIYPKMDELIMEFREIYCNNCKKVLGKYNMKYYNDDKIAEVIRLSHSKHVREGHEIELRRVSN